MLLLGILSPATSVSCPPSRSAWQSSFHGVCVGVKEQIRKKNPQGDTSAHILLAKCMQHD